MNSAKQHSDEYKKLSNEAYANLQNFLRSKGVDTVDEWLQTCLKQLSPEEAASVQKVSVRICFPSLQATWCYCQTLAEMKPTQGLQALTQPVEIAQFIASWYIGKS